MSRLNGVCVCNQLNVGSIIETVTENLLVWLNHLGMLLGELLLQISEDVLQRTIVNEASHSKRKHVLTLENGLVVHSAVLETLHCKGGDRSYDKSPVFHTKLNKWIVCLETGLGHSGFIKGVLIHKNHSMTFAPLGISLESSRIHRDKQVTEISGS